MPIYPSYPSTPYTGKLPSGTAMGPPDLLPSSSTAGYYQQRMDRPYGRNLAGLGASERTGQLPQRYVVEDDVPDVNMGKLGYDTARQQLVHILPDAEHELDRMADQDDVQGNGVFDPYATEPNVYPDAGVFAGRWNLPGYLAREQSFAPSEVLDATTGRPVTYVPSGAVAMDSVAQIAFLERGMYQQPQPVIQAQTDYPALDESTVNVAVGRRPIAPGIDAAFAGLGGLGAGPFVGVASPRARRPLRGALGEASSTSAATTLLVVGALAALAGYLVAKGGKKARKR